MGVKGGEDFCFWSAVGKPANPLWMKDFHDALQGQKNRRTNVHLVKA
jgi:hypothetical protein